MDAIYARQSVEKKDSLSIEGQIELCRRYAGEEVRIFQDRGFSGKNTKRPAFTQLMQEVEEGNIQKILVYRLDRFSRSIADFSRLWELLERCHVEFQSVTEHFDTASPMGRAMLNIVLVFAQLERETTAERVKDNYIHRFSLGAWPGGPAPYGFDLTKVPDGEGRLASALRANAQAEIVTQIFTQYAQPAASLRSVAKALTARGIHGPKREVWDSVTLSRLLHSPLYVRADEEVYWYYLSQGLQIRQDIRAFDGRHACNLVGRRNRSRNQYSAPAGQMLTVANHAGFIPSDLWLKVQDKLARNAQLPRGNAGKYSWLTGLLKCGRCGYAVKINYARAEDRFYLLCSGRSNLSNCGAAIQIDLRELEESVAGELQGMLDACPPEAIPPLPDASQAILAAEEKIDRLVAALAQSSDIAADYISRRIDRLHKEREALLAEHRRSSPRTQRLNFDAAGFPEKKLIAGEFIEKILLQDDHAEIIWKL